MKRFGLNSEYKRIKRVLLHKPTIEVSQVINPKEVYYKNSIDYKEIIDEFEGIVRTFQQHNINVSLIDAQAMDDNCQYLLNMMYARDLIFMTPRGAILGRMCKDIRKGEISYALRSLKKWNIPILGIIQDLGTLEGADVLWLNEKVCLVGVGNRTNEEGFKQASILLKEQRVECYSVSVPKGIQHLLGVVQFVDRDCVVVREKLIDSKIRDLLLKYNFKIIGMDENKEITQQQAMNIVTISPRHIFMPIDCPITKGVFESHGINVAAEIQINQLINGDGGLACATAILEREI